MECIKVIGWRTKNKYKLSGNGQDNCTSYLFSLGYNAIKTIRCGSSAIEVYESATGEFAVYSSLQVDRTREYIHINIPSEQDVKRLIDYVLRKLGF
ncbi:MAG: hypothetical protein AAF378_04535 [Cyanobacteria bacterium P01_A01_bin.84]